MMTRTRRRKRATHDHGPRIVAAICAVLMAEGPAAWSEPAGTVCGDLAVTVSARSPDEVATACSIASDADARLRELGLMAGEGIGIEVTETLDAGAGACVALYNTAQKKLQVLPPDCLQDQPGRASAFPEMEAGLLFESLIVHELTHAYVDQTVGDGFLPRIVHEYLAYAVQLDMLPEAKRDRILARAGVEGGIRVFELNEALLNLTPLRFAAGSWLHFAANGKDAALVRRVIGGDVRFRSLRE